MANKGDTDTKAPVEPSANLARPSAMKHGRSPQGTPQESKTARVDGEDTGMAAEGVGAGGTAGLAGGPPGIPVGSGIPPLPGTEVSMDTLMQEIQRMNSAMQSNSAGMQTNFSGLQAQILEQAAEFKKDISGIRAEMMTKESFKSWEIRIEKLEAGGLPNSQISWMQQQVNRLDPANKSIAFKGFTEFDGPKRSAAIESFLSNIVMHKTGLHIEHVYKGPTGQRVMSPISVTEFASRSVRESVLKKLETKPLR